MMSTSEETTVGENLVQGALEVLMPLEFYETTPEEFEKQRLAALAEVDGLCGGEEAIAAAYFGQLGAGGKPPRRDLGAWLEIYGVPSLARRVRGGGGRPTRLPRALLLAVTAKRIYAFDSAYRYSVSARKRKSGRPIEVAIWDRDAVRVEVSKPHPKTTLRIEPLDGGPKTRLAGPSSADDPWSLAVMALLDPSPTGAEVG